MPKKVPPSSLQERKGIAIVNQLVTSELEWIFREQPTDDYGIDAQVEVVEAEVATGRLIAAQIKSGPSYFTKEHTDGWWYSLRKNDLDYWLKHALPVIVVLCDTDTGAAYWEVVAPQKVVTGKGGGKKILVSRSQRLQRDSSDALAHVAEGKPYELRIRQLRLALPWMKLLQEGRRVLLEVDEWINKTSGRGDIQVISVDDVNEDQEELGTWYLMAGTRPYEDALPSLVPWADVELHAETYDGADYDAWEEECVRYDREGDRIEMVTFRDWRRKFESIGLRPYANMIDEVHKWRLELVLNHLGKGFIEVDKFAEGDGVLLTPK